ncbi:MULTISPECIES: DUF6266 family protein [Olivibacter]|uniref:DUF6266 family protein n=1 Tax=Olivibacter jilunii TaxID=985016 RepID=A0ABW6B7F7_9SPHI|nr:DUF6266 family protein [Pseudosphingobacterium sp.]
MGTYNKGINGPFSGKTGSIIGSRWRGVNYIKGFSRTYKNKGKPSEEQVLHYKKFKLLNEFFIPIKKVVEVGFGNYLRKATARNIAFQQNFDHAFSLDENNEPHLNYSLIQFSKGTLFTAGAEKLEIVKPGQIKVTWNPKTYGLGGSLDDQVHILCYTVSSGLFDSPDTTPLRYQAEATVRYEALEGECIHVWLFLSDSQKKRVSPTKYLSITNNPQPTANNQQPITNSQ